MPSSISPVNSATLTLDDVLRRRRSVREFAPTPLTDSEIHALLWAAQGITDSEGRRAAPSAGARYPLEVYAVTPNSIVHYDPATNATAVVARGDRRAALRAAAADQAFVEEAALTVALTAVKARTAERYGPGLAARYILLDTGHAAENVLLEAVALGLGAVPMAKFDPAAVQAVLGIPADHEPIELIAIGHPRP